MSSSGDPSLNLGSGGGTGILKGITTFLQQGGDITNVFIASLTGVVISPFIAVADVVGAIGTFFSTPFTEGGQAIGQLINALFTAPGSLLQAGSQISEDALRTFLGPNLAGIFALPVAVGVVMLSLYLVLQYLQEDETGDTLPGVPVDVPDPLGLTLGAEEESPEQDQDNIG